MKVVFGLLLLVGMVLICAKVCPTDVFGIEFRESKPDAMDKGQFDSKAGDLTKSDDKATLGSETKSDVEQAPREYMNEFSISIDEFNNHIHSDVLKLITNFVLGFVQFV